MPRSAKYAVLILMILILCWSLGLILLTVAEANREHNFNEVFAALKSYCLEHGTFPARLDELVTDDDANIDDHQLEVPVSFIRRMVCGGEASKRYVYIQPDPTCELPQRFLYEPIDMARDGYVLCAIYDSQVGIYNEYVAVSEIVSEAGMAK